MLKAIVVICVSKACESCEDCLEDSLRIARRVHEGCTWELYVFCDHSIVPMLCSSLIDGWPYDSRFEPWVISPPMDVMKAGEFVFCWFGVWPGW